MTPKTISARLRALIPGLPRRRLCAACGLAPRRLLDPYCSSRCAHDDD